MQQYYEIHQTNFGKYSVYIKFDDRSLWLDDLDVNKTLTLAEILDKLDFKDLSPENQ